MVKVRTCLLRLQWDLADFFLERCQEPISKTFAAMGIAPWASEQEPNVDHPALDVEPFERENVDFDQLDAATFTSDMLLYADSFDFPKGMLWDTFESSSIGVLGHDYIPSRRSYSYRSRYSPYAGGGTLCHSSSSWSSGSESCIWK